MYDEVWVESEQCSRSDIHVVVVVDVVRLSCDVVMLSDEVKG